MVFVTGSVDYFATLLTEGVIATQLFSNAGHISFIDCVGYVKLQFHDLINVTEICFIMLSTLFRYV
jgi:hypothetical protein